jgi:putative nucleotidyltransferase with HDIG domain
MSTGLPVKAKVYILVLAVFASIIFIVLFRDWDFRTTDWFTFFLFLFLTVLAESFPTQLPRGGVVSVAFAPIFASIILFHPAAVVIITVCGEILSYRKDRTFYKHIFNASQLAISVGIAAIAYRLVYQGSFQISLLHLGAVLLSISLFFLINSFFVALILAILQGFNVYSLWLTNMKWTIPNFLSTALLGLLVALIYIHIGFWGLLLFLIPLLLARLTFQSYVDMRRTFLDTIESLSVAIDAKDRYTKGHSSRVAGYAVSIARELRWPEDRLELLKYIAFMHDVGKITIPENIIKKKGNLTVDEFGQMKAHSAEGAALIKNIKFFADGADIIKHHHEHWDGGGYPERLKGEQIPIGSRILAVADAFDAMTSDRPYRRALSVPSALQELREGAAAQFDPAIVEIFVRIHPKFWPAVEPGPAPEPLYAEEAAPAASDPVKDKNGDRSGG